MDNYQAQAYLIITLREQGYTNEQIDKAKWGMFSVMDRYSETAAERKADEILGKEE